MNWLINKFKSFSLMTQAALEIFYVILLIMLFSNAIAYTWLETPIVILFFIIAIGNLWFLIHDIVYKIKNSDKDVK